MEPQPASISQHGRAWPPDAPLSWREHTTSPGGSGPYHNSQILIPNPTVQLRKKSTSPSPSRPRRAAEKSGGFDFPALVDAIQPIHQPIHQPSASTASRTVNTALTLRNWAIRELKRQIATLHFERSALSKDKEKPAAMVHKSRPEGPKSYSPVHRAGFTRQNTPRAESPRSLPFASRETRIPPCRALSGRSFTGTNFPPLRTGLKNFAPSVHFEFPAPIAPIAAKLTLKT